MSTTATSEFRRRRKANLLKVCGNKCNLCGYQKTASALEFHHINPDTKLYNIAAQGSCHQLEKDLQEVKKCILVCANCHREIHDGLYSVEELQKRQIFLEDQAQQLIIERNKTQSKTHYYCITCGREVTRKATQCIDCWNKSHRVVKERPTRDELKKLIRTTPFTQIGSQFGVTDNSIRKWCKTYSLPSKVSEIKKYTDEEWVDI